MDRTKYLSVSDLCKSLASQSISKGQIYSWIYEKKIEVKSFPVMTRNSSRKWNRWRIPAKEARRIRNLLQRGFPV